MDEKDLRTIIQQGENSQVEFKECQDRISHSVNETICSFLNYKGGTIVLGVNDQGEIIGVNKNNGSAMMKNLINTSNNEELFVPYANVMPEMLEVDELPQLLNILNGMMSIVGPRPAAVNQVEITRGGENAIAASVPCGLTSQSSLWDYIYGDQFPDEEEYNEKVLPIRLKLDVYYVKHASFFGDLKLIVWTVLAILYTACGKYPQWMHERLVKYAEEG